MKSGFKTSEFSIAAAWWFVTAFALTVLCFTPWQQGICLAPAACVLAYMSAAVSNNYGENRFLLKAERRQDEQAAAQKSEEPRRIGFGQFVANESEDDDEE